jgi:hypothetical protein
MCNYRIVGVLLIGLCLFCSGCINPARRPSNQIRAELLAATPLGTDVEQVQEYVGRRWGEPSKIQELHEGEYKKAIFTVYGRLDYGLAHDPLDLFMLFFPVDVDVLWLFDEHNRLKEVWVGKSHVFP